MNSYLNSVNAGVFYLIVALILIFITAMCLVFLVKSYRAGVKLGIDKKILKKTITASATFTLLPSISILLGVIALSGTLGVPFSWLRLSVIGSLQYELNVAEIAAQSIGLTGLRVNELSIGAFVTIALVMTIGILGGVVCCIFFFKKYMNMTMTEYLNQTRLDYALNMIQNSNKNVLTIAQTLGFSSISYFNVIFKKRYGVTPLEVRKNKKRIK